MSPAEMRGSQLIDLFLHAGVRCACLERLVMWQVCVGGKALGLYISSN